MFVPAKEEGVVSASRSKRRSLASQPKFHFGSDLTPKQNTVLQPQATRMGEPLTLVTGVSRCPTTNLNSLLRAGGAQ